MSICQFIARLAHFTVVSFEPVEWNQCNHRDLWWQFESHMIVSIIGIEALGEESLEQFRNVFRGGGSSRMVGES